MTQDIVVKVVEAAGAAVAVYVVAHAAAADGDRRLQHRTDGRRQRPITLAADAVGGAQRGNAGGEETLGGVDIADTDDEMAVLQRDRDVTLALGIVHGE